MCKMRGDSFSLASFVIREVYPPSPLTITSWVPREPPIDGY